MKLLPLLIATCILTFSATCLSQSMRTDEDIIPQRRISIETGETVLLIGDSHAQGLRRRLRENALSAGYKFVSHAVEGTMTRQWTKWLKKDIEVNNPGLIIISLGTNDAAANDAWLDRNASCYEDLLKIASESMTKAVWIGMPTYKTRRLKNVQKVSDMISSTHAVIFESISIPIKLTEDGIHATASGYVTWSDAIWDWLSEEHYVVPR